MKKIMLAAVALISCLVGSSQEIPPAPEGKSVVYFCRTSGMGFAINFTYFDSARIIGKAKGANYIRYECDPGQHLFWGRSEDKDFVEAELEAGKIYFIEVKPQMGMIKAALELKAVDPAKDEKAMKRIMKLLEKKDEKTFTEEKLESDEKKMEEVIQAGLEKYKKDKEKGKKMERLEKTMYYIKA